MRPFLKILTLFIAVGAVGGAVMIFKKHPWAYRVTLACGILLMLWIVLEWYVWGFVALSNIYFVLGLIEAVASFYCIVDAVAHRLASTLECVIRLE